MDNFQVREIVYCRRELHKKCDGCLRCEKKPDFTESFKNKLLGAIKRKYKPKAHYWKPQPGIQMTYNTIRGYKEKDVEDCILKEDFVIKELTVLVGTANVKFILTDEPFEGD